MDYDLVAADCMNDLKVIVKSYLNEGWQCQGGVAVVRSEYPDALRSENQVAYEYYQAMIRVTRVASASP